MPSELEIRERTAREYDQLYQNQSGYWHLWVEEKVVMKLLDAQPTDCVLDAGCGTGRFTQKLAPRVQHIVAFDHSARSVALAKSKTAQYHNVVAFTHDIMQPIVSKELDKVLCVQVLQHVENPMAAVRNLRSCLKDDGMLVATVYNVDHFYFGRLAKRELTARGEFSNGIPYQRFSYDEVLTLFSSCGFRKVEIFGCVNASWYELVGKNPFVYPIAVLDTLLSWHPISSRLGCYLAIKGTK